MKKTKGIKIKICGETQKKSETKTHKFIICDDRDRVEYNIIVSDNGNKKIYSLFSSDNEVWCEGARGQLLLKLTNHGNGIKLNKIKKSLKYNDVEYLRILLTLEHLQSRTSHPVKITNENRENPVLV